MDIRKVAARLTDALHLRDGQGELLWDADVPAGSPAKPVRVIVHGPGSRVWAAANTARSVRMLERSRKKGKQAMTSDEARAEQATYLADLTEGFENFEFDDLQGRALAEAVYNDQTLGFIADQVASHTADWANFTKALPTT